MTVLLLWWTADLMARLVGAGGAPALATVLAGYVGVLALTTTVTWATAPGR